MKLLTSNTLTMSSREIAELTGKQHKHVLADIRVMLTEMGSAEISAQYKDVTGRSLPMIILNKRECLILVSGYSITLRARIIDRWQELEAATVMVPVLPQNYKEALLALVSEVEAREQVEATLALAAPKAQVYDRVIERTNLLNATQVAEQVGMSAVKMNRHLDALGGVYSKAVKRGRVFVQPWIDCGYGEVKQTEQGYPQALFTPKGAARIVELFVSDGII